MVKNILIVSCLVIIASSCVSSKKFSDLEVLKEYYKLKGDTLLIVQNENKTLNRTLNQTKNNLANTQSDLNSTKSSLSELQGRHDKLSRDYKDLEDNLQKLSASSQSETQSLRGQLNQANRENNQMKAILTNLDNAYQLSENGTLLTDDNWTKKFQRMQEVSETLESEKVQMDQLFELMAPLPAFQKDGMEVVKGAGKLIVRMRADIIFRSGGNQVNTKGRKTIAEITGIILRNSNLDVHVEGHTDTKGSDNSNWTTSVLRASAVAKQMVSNDFMPTRLYAIGRSSHDPINPEDSSEARKQNRRVEIIIKPKSALP